MNSINSRFLCHAICGFNDDEILAGRPYGGCTILWRATMLARVETINTMSRRICAIKLCTDLFSILFVNVYIAPLVGCSRVFLCSVYFGVFSRLLVPFLVFLYTNVKLLNSSI